MMNRKSLIFALCAMSMMMGFAGCADDSSSKTEEELPQQEDALTLSKNTVSLPTGDNEVVVATHSTPSVTAVSKDNSCIVALTGNANDGKTDITLMAFSGKACETTIEVTAGTKTETIKGSVTVVAGKPVIIVNPNETIQAGASKGISADCQKDSNPLANFQITVTSSDETCFTVEPGSVSSDNNGKANFTIKANEDKACKGEVSVKGEGADGRTIGVNVTKDGATPEPGPDEQDPVVEGGKLEFYDLKPAEGPADLNLNSKKSSSEVKVHYFDSSNQNINGAKITYEIADKNCIILTDSVTVKTDASGIAKNTVKAKNPDSLEGCSSEVTIKTTDDTVNTLTLNVTVAPKGEYDMNVKLNFDSKKAQKVDYARVFLSDETCENLLKAPANLPDVADNADTKLEVEPIDTTGNPLGTVKFDDVPVGAVSVVAYAQNEAGGSVMGYGCTRVEMKEANVNVDLTEMPTNIIGKYDIVSNYDFSSAFLKDAAKDLPAVEDMKAGDWIKFVVEFVDDPVDTLLDFIWVNTLSRLAKIDGIPGFVKDLLNDSMKEMAKAALRPIINDYLGPKDGAKDNWYTILTKVGPDIKDITTNMQFQGVLDIKKAEADKITNATLEYNELQYQWSLDEAGCMPDVYAKPKSCRAKMTLTAKKGTSNISGDWTGSIDDPTKASYDADLTIDPMSLKFDWASILYVAVFGEILPRALDYKTADSIKEGQYIEGFLEKLVFQPVSKNYTDKIHKGQYDKSKDCWNITADDKTKCYKDLSAEGDCEKFIQSIVYLIIAEPGSVGEALVKTAYDMGCGPKGLGQLETLVQTNLKKVSASTGESVTLAANACGLYDEGTIDYRLIGKPDSDFWTAFNVFAGGKETSRCQWQLKFTTGDNANKTVKGLFHATRK